MRSLLSSHTTSRHTRHSGNGEPDPLPDNKKAVLYQLQLYILVLLNFDIDTVKYVLPLRWNLLLAHSHFKNLLRIIAIKQGVSMLVWWDWKRLTSRRRQGAIYKYYIFITVLVLVKIEELYLYSPWNEWCCNKDEPTPELHAGLEDSVLRQLFK